MGNIFKPILFSTPMVKAILDDEKTQTRRTKGLEEINKNPDAWRAMQSNFSSKVPFSGCVNRIGRDLFIFFRSDSETLEIKVPYQIGNILWVRETSITLRDEHLEGREGNIYYKTEERPLTSDFLKECGYKWTPAIHMKKTSCRVFLKVKSVRAERLHEITIEDALSEGIEKAPWAPGWKHYTNPSKYLKDKFYGAMHGTVISFMSLWMKINGKESLDLNPWVWVIEFERIDKPHDFYYVRKQKQNNSI
ncbi:hypothetical protein [Flavobacterium sp. F52]|uniref:hypothetical protein n=1 Tax=Flavobacterium sp. F52 TaxID=1202532 RepID=UPI000272DFC2|nr:hypothetical protein [Flavobacterium sp. F52]EJG02266.1 hypothetical protein FF52_06285 [Flavobacterium sp. F52]